MSIYFFFEIIHFQTKPDIVAAGFSSEESSMCSDVCQCDWQYMLASRQALSRLQVDFKWELADFKRFSIIFKWSSSSPQALFKNILEA